MKAFIGLVVIILVAAGVWYFMGSQAPQGQNQQPADGEQVLESSAIPGPGEYAVVPGESTVLWTAQKPLIAGYIHRGTIGLKEGTITVGDNTASGSFTIDMTTVRVTSLGGGKAGRESQLESHLKTGDFFDVTTYPTATFAISTVTPTETEGVYTVTGNLTMKGITDEVSFPASIVDGSGSVRVVAEFTIDRTMWNVNFGSASLFDNLAENAISNEVVLDLDIIARKQSDN